jgi:hypothetical protein
MKSLAVSTAALLAFASFAQAQIVDPDPEIFDGTKTKRAPAQQQQPQTAIDNWEGPSLVIYDTNGIVSQQGQGQGSGLEGTGSGIDGLPGLPGLPGLEGGGAGLPGMPSMGVGAPAIGSPSLQIPTGQQGGGQESGQESGQQSGQ